MRFVPLLHHLPESRRFGLVGGSIDVGESMVKKRTVIIYLSVILLPLMAHKAASQSPPAATPPERIALHEAEILIYLLPQAQELRNQGMDIGWELETSPEVNQQNFYTFWVVNSKRPNVQGSVTIGYFSVNKHTAEVWDDDREKLVSSSELEGVQRILRQAHHIDESTLRRFSPLRPRTSG